MPIHRSPRKSRFTIIGNDLINDSRISVRSLGVLCRLLSKPDDWKLDQQHMANEFNMGRDAVRATIKELQEAGYLVANYGRDKQGRMTSEWIIYDKSTINLEQQNQEETAYGNPVAGDGKPVAGEPDARNWSTVGGEPVTRNWSTIDGKPVPIINTIDKDKSLAVADEAAKPKKQKSSTPELDLEAADIPDWIDREALDAYIAMRKRIKKPMDQSQLKFTLARLKKFKADGLDANEALSASVANGWQGIFPPRETKSKPASDVPDYLQGNFINKTW